MTTPDSQFPYQDASLDIGQRVEDLLSRMELEDKAGLMVQPMATMGEFTDDGWFGTPSMRTMLDRRINHFNILTAPTAREIAEWYNRVQDDILSRPLGIPATVSTDPRHSFTDNPATALFAGPFSQWPEPLGFAAIGDEDLVRRFTEIVREEYLAVGLRTALHPQLDLATEPRWSRNSGGYGSIASLSARLGVAQIETLQGATFGEASVAAMAKHFPGGGPQKDGEDPHFDFGKEQIYPGGNYELHLEPFRAAIAAGVRQIMPYYGMPIGLEIDGEAIEEVGFAFNKQILTGQLRERLGFDGIICTDWMVLTDKVWGVENLTVQERLVKALDAGVDQFGGEFGVKPIIEAVRTGAVAESRLDVSVRRLLRQKFELGLFDGARYVDPDAADRLVGSESSVEQGVQAQAQAVTVLTNGTGEQPLLPLKPETRIFLEGADAEAFAGRATVVDSPADADVSLIRLAAPWEEIEGEGNMFSGFHRGSLAFSDEVIERVRELAAVSPVIVDVFLDRPALLGQLTPFASSVIVNFGAGAEAIARVLFGEEAPLGRLPFEIPVSMEAVEASFSDTPNDSVSPVFEVGHGLSI